MTAPTAAELPPPDAIAFLLDFDGTLVDIAPRPMAVRVVPALPSLLARLAAVSGGALAVVTGRPIAEIDRLLPGVAVVAGQHGAELRTGDGETERCRIEAPVLGRLRAAAEALAARLPGVEVEDKGSAVAVHYRARPLAAATVAQHLAHLARSSRGAFVLQPGKMVFELRPAGADKGGAIRRLMRDVPFAGRRPVFAGDDLTDEAGFAAVAERGGLALKIGPGDSTAQCRLPDPQALRTLLAAYLARHAPKECC